MFACCIYRNVTNHHLSRAYPAVAATSTNNAFPSTSPMSPSTTTHTLPFSSYPILQGTSQRRDFQDRLPQSVRAPSTIAQQDELVRRPPAADLSRQSVSDSWDMRGYSIPRSVYSTENAGVSQQAATVKRSFFD